MKEQETIKKQQEEIAKLQVNLNNKQDALDEALEDLKESEKKFLEYSEKKENSFSAFELQDMNAYDFHRFLCDVFGVIYHTSKETILTYVNEKMNQK